MCISNQNSPYTLGFKGRYTQKLLKLKFAKESECLTQYLAKDKDKRTKKVRTRLNRGVQFCQR